MGLTCEMDRITLLVFRSMNVLGDGFFSTKVFDKVKIEYSNIHTQENILLEF